MRLSHGIHLAYCTNIHRGGDWPETFQSLREHTLRVRDRVSPDEPYAIGLRLGDTASRQLGQADELVHPLGQADGRRCHPNAVQWHTAHRDSPDRGLEACVP